MILPRWEEASYDTPRPFDQEKHKFLGERPKNPDNVRILFPGLLNKDGQVWQEVKAVVVSI